MYIYVRNRPSLEELLRIAKGPIRLGGDWFHQLKPVGFAMLVVWLAALSKHAGLYKGFRSRGLPMAEWLKVALLVSERRSLGVSIEEMEECAVAAVAIWAEHTTNDFSDRNVWCAVQSYKWYLSGKGVMRFPRDASRNFVSAPFFLISRLQRKELISYNPSLRYV